MLGAAGLAGWLRGMSKAQAAGTGWPPCIAQISWLLELRLQAGASCGAAAALSV